MTESDLSAAISAYMGRVEARRAEVWGQMCRERAQRERGCVPTAAQVAAVDDFRTQMRRFYSTVGARLETCVDNTDSPRVVGVDHVV